MRFLPEHAELGSPTFYTDELELTLCAITQIIKNWIIVQRNSRDLIGLAAMVYEPLEIATIKLVFWLFCRAKSVRSSNLC